MSFGSRHVDSEIDFGFFLAGCHRVIKPEFYKKSKRFSEVVVEFKVMWNPNIFTRENFCESLGTSKNWPTYALLQGENWLPST